MKTASPPSSVTEPLTADTTKPADSSSMLESITSAGFRPTYSDAVVLVLLSRMMRKPALPSETLSSCPTTRTSCSDLQLPELNVRVAGETVPSVSLSELTDTTTFPEEGRLVRRTVKTASPPSSVTEPLTDETTKPADSSSMLESITSAGFRPTYSLAVVLLLLSRMMRKPELPSETLSS